MFEGKLNLYSEWPKPFLRKDYFFIALVALDIVQHILNIKKLYSCIMINLVVFVLVFVKLSNLSKKKRSHWICSVIDMVVARCQYYDASN